MGPQDIRPLHRRSASPFSPQCQTTVFSSSWEPADVPRKLAARSNAFSTTDRIPQAQF